MTTPSPTELDKSNELLPCPFCGAVPKPNDRDFVVGHDYDCFFTHAYAQEGWLVGRKIKKWQNQTAAKRVQELKQQLQTADEALAVSRERVQELEKQMDFCPECGCIEVKRTHGHDSDGGKQCAQCGQSRFTDVNYTDTIRGHLRQLSQYKTAYKEAVEALKYVAKNAVFPLGTIPERPWDIVNKPLSNPFAIETLKEGSNE